MRDEYLLEKDKVFKDICVLFSPYKQRINKSLKRAIDHQIFVFSNPQPDSDSYLGRWKHALSILRGLKA